MSRRPSIALPVRAAAAKPLTRRQWERQQIADAFMVLGLSIGSIAATVTGPKRWTLSVTLKGRRVVSSLPEIQAQLDEAWARVKPSKEQLDRDWAQWKLFTGAARKLGRAAGRSMDREMVKILRGAAT